MVMKPHLVLRALELSVLTPAGNVGRTITFQSGLNIIRADNTSGKSTTLQAIIYALGLEGMLSARRDIPLPHAMTHQVSVGGSDQTVLQSSVSLEIENGTGEVITVTRQVKNPAISPWLINVTFGPTITSQGEFKSQDYFVRRPGSAQREAGFHHFLPQFLGWELPQVTMMDGSEGPLYIETLFPYFYVEQKHGWSGVQARIPTYLGIRDVGKRSAEFVLGLEAFRRILQRQRISFNIATLETQWKNKHQEMLEVAKAASVSLSKPPSKVSDSLDEESASPIVYIGNTWIPIDDAVSALSKDLAARNTRPVPSVGTIAHQLETDLENEENAINSTLIALNVIIEERGQLRDRRDQLALRASSLEEDLQRHKDSLTLVGLGSLYASSFLADYICPTCHQDIHDGMDISAHAMTATENIDFIGRQLTTFKSTLDDVTRSLVAVEVRERSLREALTVRRRQVRAHRDTLAGTNNAPSLAEVSERVAIQDRLDRLLDRTKELDLLRTELHDFSKDHENQKRLLSAIDPSKLSDLDLDKIQALESYLRSQLVRYHFGSLPTGDVEINRETYRPSHEGFELGFDLSASDMIRVIWSYLLAIMRVSEEQAGNHLGLLIFDEPRQQETAPESYRELLQEAAEQGNKGSQIIFATSESRAGLLAMLKGANYHLVDIPSGQKLLMPLNQ